MIPKQIGEDLISTAMAVSIMGEIMGRLRRQIQAKRTVDILPALVTCSLDDTGKFETQGVEMDFSEIEQLEAMMNSTLCGYADAGTMVVLIIFGALAEVDDYENNELADSKLGFVLRATTLDGRNVTGFMPLDRPVEGDPIVVTDKKTLIEVSDKEDSYDDGLMSRLRATFVSRYGAHKQRVREGKSERLN